MKNTVLIAGGHDPSGGAGLSADIKTSSFFQCYPLSIVTAITFQNYKTFDGLEAVSLDVLKKQLTAVIHSYSVKYAKIGLTGNATNLYYLISFLSENNIFIVFDPVISTSSGGKTMDDASVKHLKNNFNKIFLLTPNIPEAQILTGLDTFSQKELGLKLIQSGCQNVLVKGGHNKGDSSDFLFIKDKLIIIQGDRLKTENTRGTGCTLSTAITSLAASGLDLENSCRIAKQYLEKTMEHEFKPGKNPYPLNNLLI